MNSISNRLYDLHESQLIRTCMSRLRIYGEIRRTVPSRGLTSICTNGIRLLSGSVILCASLAWSQNGNGYATPSLTTAQIVEAMQQHEQMQTNNLQHYQAVRHYSVVYRGFARTMTASMEVEVNYEAATGKSFRIISQNGSGTLYQKVLKRALESEREAWLYRSTTALSPVNYKFEFIAMDRVENRPAYVLNVDPITSNKFLYRGKIWVDAADFAVAMIDVEPAKNPSFWISRTLIHHTNSKTCGFWLPAQNRSETRVRVGGSAVMTIDYGAYKIVSKTDSSKFPALSSNH